MNKELVKLTDPTRKLKNQDILTWKQAESSWRKKVHLHNVMVWNINLIIFQLGRQEHYIRNENILIYGVLEYIDNHDLVFSSG